MTKAEITLKKGVRENKEYTLKAIDAPVKLNQNESPFDLPLHLKQIILEKAGKADWNIYPEFVPTALYNKAASYYGLTGNHILLGNGSNEMINTILCGTLEGGKKLVIPVPTFTVYKLIATNLNASVVEIPLNADFSFNVERIREESRTEGSVTVICSPNNPTGSSMSKRDMESIITASGGIVVIDEAYIQFGGESVMDLVNTYDNLIILRTLSKAVGLAGLRLGIMISNTYIISQLGKVKLPYNLDIFSLNVLDVVYDNMNLFENTAKLLNDERLRIFNELDRIGNVNYYKSDANFFIVKSDNAELLFNGLLQDGILVRNVSSYAGLQGCLRISVGSPQQNDKLLDAFRRIYTRGTK